MFGGANGLTKRRQFCLGQFTAIPEPGAVAMPVSVSSVCRKFTTAVFSIFMKVDIAQVHQATVGSSPKGAVIRALDSIDITRRLGAVSCSVRQGCESRTLFRDDLIRHVFDIVVMANRFREPQANTDTHARNSNCAEKVSDFHVTCPRHWAAWIDNAMNTANARGPMRQPI